MHFQDLPSPFQDSAAYAAARRGAESGHPPSPTPTEVQEVTELPAAPRHVPRSAGARPVKRKRSMDGGQAPVEQVLRAAAANLRFSDCPAEHTDEIAKSLTHIRVFMERMSDARRLRFILRMTQIAHAEVVEERQQQEDRERQDREKLHEAEMERLEREEREREMEDRHLEVDFTIEPGTYDVIDD